MVKVVNLEPLRRCFVREFPRFYYYLLGDFLSIHQSAPSAPLCEASIRIVRPLLELLTKPDTSKERSFVIARCRVA